jgi:hypothetical protein
MTDIKLDAEERPRGELAAADFTLCTEARRLMSVLDSIQNGKISKIEVRAGVPRRLVVESRLAETELIGQKGT